MRNTSKLRQTSWTASCFLGAFLLLLFAGCEPEKKVEVGQWETNQGKRPSILYQVTSDSITFYQKSAQDCHPFWEAFVWFKVVNREQTDSTVDLTIDYIKETTTVVRFYTSGESVDSIDFRGHTSPVQKTLENPARKPTKEQQLLDAYQYNLSEQVNRKWDDAFLLEEGQKFSSSGLQLINHIDSLRTELLLSCDLHISPDSLVQWTCVDSFAAFHRPTRFLFGTNHVENLDEQVPVMKLKRRLRHYLSQDDSELVQTVFPRFAESDFYDFPASSKGMETWEVGLFYQQTLGHDLLMLAELRLKVIQLERLSAARSKD